MSKFADLASPTDDKQIKYLLLVITCCILAVITSIISITFHNQTSQQFQNANLFVFLYESDLTDGSSLTIDKLDQLENSFKHEWQAQHLSIFSAQFIQSSMENFDRQRRQTKSFESLKGDPLLISVVIHYPIDSISNLTNQIANLKKHLRIPIRFTNGQTRNVHLTFSCDQQTAKDFHKINNLIETSRTIFDLELNRICSINNEHHRNKRQTESNSSLIDVPEMFNPEVVGHFQLGLKSDTTVVVLIGNDNNLYLSEQTNLAANFSLVDLMLSNDSNTALIKDTKTDRYVHSYNEIRDVGYSRVRTHLESSMPCDAALMFWTFASGFLQFFRGGSWFYDTAACLDSLTGLTKIWIVNGQQGLTNLTTNQGYCALAQLTPINYD